MATKYVESCNIHDISTRYVNTPKILIEPAKVKSLETLPRYDKELVISLINEAIDSNSVSEFDKISNVLKQIQRWQENKDLGSNMECDFFRIINNNYAYNYYEYNNKKQLDSKKAFSNMTIPKVYFYFLLFFSILLCIFGTILIMDLFTGVFLVKPGYCLLLCCGSIGMIFTIISAIKEWKKQKDE